MGDLENFRENSGSAAFLAARPAFAKALSLEIVRFLLLARPPLLPRSPHFPLDVTSSKRLLLRL